jgi:hypothetical protein
VNTERVLANRIAARSSDLHRQLEAKLKAETSDQGAAGPLINRFNIVPILVTIKEKRR